MNSHEFIDQPPREVYVVVDLFSRYVVAWMVAAHENSALAKQLFEEAVPRYGVDAGTLTVHHDRGAPMTSHTFKDLLKELGVNQSMSRPRVSNDNAFSESLFRTVKYQPDYPGRFADIDAARAWFQDFFDWYNEHHHHEGIALFVPGQVYRGEVAQVAGVRQKALDAAYTAHPSRCRRLRCASTPSTQPRDRQLATLTYVIDDLWPRRTTSACRTSTCPARNHRRPSRFRHRNHPATVSESLTRTGSAARGSGERREVPDRASFTLRSGAHAADDQLARLFEDEHRARHCDGEGAVAGPKGLVSKSGGRAREPPPPGARRRS